MLWSIKYSIKRRVIQTFSNNKDKSSFATMSRGRRMCLAPRMLSGNPGPCHSECIIIHKLCYEYHTPVLHPRRKGPRSRVKIIKLWCFMTKISFWPNFWVSLRVWLSCGKYFICLILHINRSFVTYLIINFWLNNFIMRNKILFVLFALVRADFLDLVLPKSCP